MAYLPKRFHIENFKQLLNTARLLQIPSNLRVLVFGGALNSDCYRYRLLQHFSKDQTLLTIIPDKINYFDISSANYNLIEKEARLFENSDILMVIPESAGSFAEIGMIASMISNHSKKSEKVKLAEKILIILDIEYKYDESFLKLGPIKIIKAYGGKHIHVNFHSGNFSKVNKHLNSLKFSKQNKQIRIDDSSDNKTEQFFINCIKILLYIYTNKYLVYGENEYKTSFIANLKNIHISIGVDNIEYLESIDLISKMAKESRVIITVNHEHPFMKDIINLNYDFFKRHKLIHNFLIKSGY